MKTRLLIVTETASYDYTQSNRGHVEDLELSRRRYREAINAISGSNFNATYTIDEPGFGERSWEEQVGTIILPTTIPNTEAAREDESYSQYRLRREQERLAADERSRQRARSNNWSHDDIPF